MKKREKFIRRIQLLKVAPTKNAIINKIFSGSLVDGLSFRDEQNDDKFIIRILKPFNEKDIKVIYSKNRSSKKWSLERIEG